MQTIILLAIEIPIIFIGILWVLHFRNFVKSMKGVKY